MTEKGDLDEQMCDEWLDAPAARSDERLRQTLRIQTTRIIGRRRAKRRIAATGICLFCYAAGIATTRLSGFFPGNGPETVRRAAQTASVSPVAPPGRAQAARAKPPSTAAEIRAAVARMQRDKPSRFESLRRLGDVYLEDQKDPEGAVRCYRLALRYATPEELAGTATKSSWMMAALLLDLNREKLHANGIN